MSSRAGFRLSHLSRLMRQSPRRPIGRRYQTTDTAPNTSTQNLAQQWWQSPIGPKTVHFWAPVMKWAIVIAGISDLTRPAEKLSLTQNVALTATGAIWTRWCLIIKPRNVLLATVNFFLGCVGVTQVGRILQYQRSVKNGSISKVVEQDATNIAGTAGVIAKDPEGAVQNAVK